MIIDFNVNYNNYNERVLNNYLLFTYKCPKCGAKHSCIRHASYERNICFINADHNIISKKMNILRVKCNSCKSTHAILPNDIIPYCIYSFSFILSVLKDYYIDNDKISDICSNYSIIISAYLYFYIKVHQIS
jgi:transcription elongation factor Elf1